MWTTYGMDSVENMSKQTEHVFADFPQCQPLTLQGLLNEWVAVKNMIKIPFQSLSIRE